MRFAVLGGGSWATALVKMLCENLPEVIWYMRSPEAIEHIGREGHNPNYLSSVEFDVSKLRDSANLHRNRCTRFTEVEGEYFSIRWTVDRDRGRSGSDLVN